MVYPKFTEVQLTTSAAFVSDPLGLRNIFIHCPPKIFFLVKANKTSWSENWIFRSFMVIKYVCIYNYIYTHIFIIMIRWSSSLIYWFSKIPRRLWERLHSAHSKDSDGCVARRRSKAVWRRASGTWRDVTRDLHPRISANNMESHYVLATQKWDLITYSNSTMKNKELGNEEWIWIGQKWGIPL